MTATTIHFVTLETTLMPSMSSGERILICDVPFKNCSDSDIPVGQKQGQTTGINYTSISGKANVLTQTGPFKAAVAGLSIFRHSIISDHHS